VKPQEKIITHVVKYHSSPDNKYPLEIKPMQF